ncbi:MAG TPA: response regulator transcription factor [Chitinophagaceae bacterium]|nr:response regulator transcription factor [Chitinophagaceae bacterium]
MEEKIKVIYYEDNSNLREGISFLIQSTPQLDLLATFSNADTVKVDTEELKPDVILMDIDMPGTNGIDAVAIVKAVSPKTQVIMLTVFDNEEKIFNAIRNGASGYLLKHTPPSEIIDSIFDVNKGGSPMTANVARKVLQYFQSQPKAQKADYNLSERELQIVKGLVSGYSYKAIASELFISIDTVRSHIRRIYEKLHVNSKTEAVLKAINEGLV